MMTVVPAFLRLPTDGNNPFLSFQSPADSVEAEVALVYIYISEGNKKKVYQVCDFYRARKIENENNTTIFEIAGASDRVNRFIKEINEITKIEIVRSGPVAISSILKNEEE